MSQRQVDANRINGAKGGVKTWEGKQISKMNAVRHGFTSKKLVLTTEEEPHFNEIMEGYLEELNPQIVSRARANPGRVNPFPIIRFQRRIGTHAAKSERTQMPPRFARNHARRGPKRLLNRTPRCQ